MTRKDYEKIAQIIDGATIVFPPECIDAVSKDVWLRGADDQKRIYVRALSDMLLNDNPRFNRDKFYKACGL